MGAKKFSHTHMSTVCGLKKLASGIFPEVEKCWQNGGGGDGPKTTSPPVTQGDLIITPWSFITKSNDSSSQQN